MLNKRTLALAGALTVLPQMVYAADAVAGRCVDVSVRQMDRVDLGPMAVPARHLRDEPDDPAWLALWRQGGALDGDKACTPMTVPDALLGYRRRRDRTLSLASARSEPASFREATSEFDADLLQADCR